MIKFTQLLSGRAGIGIRSVLISCCLRPFCGGNESGTGGIWLKREDGEGILGGKAAAWTKAQRFSWARLGADHE